MPQSVLLFGVMEMATLGAAIVFSQATTVYQFYRHGESLSKAC